MENSKQTLLRILNAAGIVNAGNDADNLISKFGSLGYLMQCDAYVMREYTGCSEETAHILRLTAELSSRRLTDRIKPGRKYSESEIKQYIAALFFASSVEQVYCVMFDANGRYIATEFMGDGTVNAAGFMPRKLLDAACRRGAKSLILAHNHPCGSPLPSKDDYVTTDQMRNVVRNSGIEFIEHYVVSGFEIYGILSDFNSPTPTPDSNDVLRVGIDPIL